MNAQEVTRYYYTETGSNSRMCADLDSAVLARLYTTPPDKWEHLLYVKVYVESTQQVLPGVVLSSTDQQKLLVLAAEVCVDTLAWIAEHQPLWMEDTDIRSTLKRLRAEVRVDNNTELHFAGKNT